MKKINLKVVNKSHLFADGRTQLKIDICNQVGSQVFRVTRTLNRNIILFRNRFCQEGVQI